MQEIPADTELELQSPGEFVADYEAMCHFCECVQEKLRRDHNEMGARYRNDEITEPEWQLYLETIFGPRNQATGRKILELRAEVKNAARALADDSAELAGIDLSACFVTVEK